MLLNAFIICDSKVDIAHTTYHTNRNNAHLLFDIRQSNNRFINLRSLRKIERETRNYRKKSTQQQHPNQLNKRLRKTNVKQRLSCRR